MAESVPAPASNDPGALGPASEPTGQNATGTSASRYVQERVLGQGAMGAVYLVRDRETGEQLALKKLFRMDARSVLRVKREFRSLADISHPNLVKVYELGHADEGWFLAMEYVAGPDLQTFLGFNKASVKGSRLEAAFSQLTSRRIWIDELMLPAFYQLASGIHALHRAGMLHRDLKPSNVLVANRRVVVLDFGLVRELDPNAPALTEDGAISGTPAYMAPEQALGQPLSEATDWYAFGVMLYEVLTGELPFDGSGLLELIRAKLEKDAPTPDKFSAEVPANLANLCCALLARDPLARPTGSEVLRRLEPVRLTTATAPVTLGESLQTEQLSLNAAPFFGRVDELRQLWEAMREVELGREVVVHVRGVSGAGKSALVERFLAQLERQTSAAGGPDALVLRSRCYEREAMPYKALDGVLDALSRHLSQLDDFEVSHLLPTEIGALSQLFPVLERLRAVQHLLAVRVLQNDSLHNRQRAELALRELFSRMASRRPLVVWIDDLQWGDLDSAGILKGWLQHAVDQPLLLLLSYRADEVETSECLRLLLGAAHKETAAVTKTLQVSALAANDVSDLCREQLGTRARGHDELVQRIVREADGSPFLAAQLTALVEARLSRGEADVNTVSLSDLVAQNNALLPPDARHLLGVLSVAGRPISPKLALRAAGIRRGGREIVHALRRRLLLRTRDVAGERLLEVYHDRVRESVQRSLGAAESEQLHANLLSALEYSGRADPDWLHRHALGAKQRVPALHYGLQAAERAMTTLAFEHAAELYTQCLELSDDADEQRALLTEKLATALAGCGHGSKAADAYSRAAQLTTGPQSALWLRLATSHLLRSGRFAEGTAMLRRVLEVMGVRIPETRFGIVVAVIWERIRVAHRRANFSPRSEAEIPAALLVRIATFRSLAVGLQSIDTLRSALFALRALRWALEAGEPMRVLDALSGVTLYLSIGGSRSSERRADQLVAQSAELAAKIGTPAARASLCASQAITAFMLGRPEAVLAPSYEAERLSRTLSVDPEGSYFMRFSVVTARLGALYVLADYRGFAAELHAALDEARATENVAAMLYLALNETLLDEIEDRVEDSVARLEQQRGWLPAEGYSIYHTQHLISICQAANVTGRFAWAKRILEQDWPAFLRSTIGKTAILGSVARGVRLRLLLNIHVIEKAGDASLRAIRKEVAALERASQGPMARTYVAMLGARIAYISGDAARASELYRQTLARAATPGDAERVRYVLGTILGSEAGAAMCAQAEQRLRELGVVHPQHFVHRHFPELFGQ